MGLFFHHIRKSGVFCSVLIVFVFLVVNHQLLSQNQSNIAADSTISGIINRYTPVLSISSGCSPILEVENSNGFSVGDRVLIIQMQGAEIDVSNSANYGRIVSYNNAGNYEFARIHLIANNTIYLRNPLLKAYTIAGKVQLIRVPEYQNVTIDNTLSGQSWNGSVGGVIALYVNSILTIKATISATGIGFRGGLAVNAPIIPPNHTTDYYNLNSLPGYGGAKGEGIAYYGKSPNTNGKGAPANGGGGGNNHNAGGGGGANIGAGGTGGFGWEPTYTGDNLLSLGLGGYIIDNSNHRLFMGGGGGSGHVNQNDKSSGGKGGGIIIIVAEEIISSPSYPITADGNQGGDALPDGAGGGGGGGSIILSFNKFNGISNISVSGGRGGNNVYTGGGIAPGGGGGGGGIYLSLPIIPNGVTCSVTGGVSGMITVDNSTFGASSGKDGGIFNNYSIPESSITGSTGTADAGADRPICINDTTTIGSLAQAGYSYSWSPQSSLSNPSAAQPIAKPLMTTDYILTTTSPTGCVSTDTVRVVVNPLVPLEFTLSPDTVRFVPNEQFQTELHIPPGIFEWHIRLLYNSLIAKFDTILQKSNNISLPLPLDNNTGQLSINGVGDNGSVLLRFKTYLPHTNDSIFTLQMVVDSAKTLPCGRPFGTGTTLKTLDYCGKNFRYVSGTGNIYFLTSTNQHINFGVGLPGRIRLEVFDYLGRSYQILTDAHFEPGTYSASFDLPIGLYFCRMSAGVVDQTVKVVVVQ
ncbi:MAG: hypothetical protein IPM69_05585 [Ignavibacteria bacterium]|nr:hypothetical protein [Ignavibacteria bacterium]